MRVHGDTGAGVPSWKPQADNDHKPQRNRVASFDAAGSQQFYGLPLDATDEHIENIALDAAAAVYRAANVLMNSTALRMMIDALCIDYGINKPAGKDDAECIKRGADKNWWLRQLRKEHLRRCEHVAIARGDTGAGVSPYISIATAMRQRKRNADNQKALEATTLENEHGQKYTMAELAALGTANKAIRRGELMTRIRGFEEIATILNHAAVFATITCPSKYHSQGGKNKRYNGATPRQAQRYLTDTYKLMRTAISNASIRPYGFRIAEPHQDGCPHWHILYFIERKDVPKLERIIRKYALAEDGDESGAAENRVKLVHIESEKGSAAGYIAKYVCKNIDGEGVGEHKAFEGGETYVIKTDKNGNMELTPSARVTYWSQVWGIRQFQQVGGPPIGVWRELRRVKAETVENACDTVKAAWHACQAVKSENEEEAKQADFAAYTLAMGGVRAGRNVAVQLYRDVIKVEGKYSTYYAKKPVGVVASACMEVIYKSVRYVWTITRPTVAAPVVVAVPRTCVNNCTPEQVGEGAPWVKKLEKGAFRMMENVIDKWNEYRKSTAPDEQCSFRYFQEGLIGG